MKLTKLLQTAALNAPENGDTEILGVTDDSRAIQPGSLFVAVRGTQVDGHQFIPQAIKAGAAAIVAMEPAPQGTYVPWIQAPDTQLILGPLAHAIAGDPTESMTVVGITGTNGKTTVAWLIESILQAAGHKTGLLGTVEYRFEGQSLHCPPTTTASACDNAQWFAEMKQAGVQAAAMEVSSHAIDQHRIAGIRFRAGVLTNITQDHLDYHASMDDYAAAKRRFFDETIAANPGAIAVFNLDDEYGRQFSQEYQAEQITFSQSAETQVRCVKAEVAIDGIRLQIEAQGEKIEIESPLLGRFNVENLLAAAATAHAIGIDATIVTAGLATARGVPGRFERIDEGQSFLVAVDYAHTPDALQRVLQNARELSQGRLIAVFGCGGDRDPGKRPLMGAAAGQIADFAILTNDNPRTEDPSAIANMAESGLKKADPTGERYLKILDRREAIAHAIGIAREGDFVLIAGKGHEDYQILGTEKIHFDDREEARNALRARQDGASC